MSFGGIIFRVVFFSLIYILSGLSFFIPLAQFSAPLSLVSVMGCLWVISVATMILYQIICSRLDNSMMTVKVKEKRLYLNIISSLSFMLILVISSTYTLFRGHFPVVFLIFLWILWIFFGIIVFKLSNTERSKARYRGLKFLIAWVLIIVIVMSVSSCLKIDIFQWRL